MSWLYCSFFFYNSCFSQKLLKLSQNSNHFIYELSNGLVFISSTDGINIYNGRENKIYRSLTHNMIGENIQSDFHEDREGRVWFATYKALNVYIHKIDDFKSFQFEDSKGNIINSDYRLIGQFNDTLCVLSGHQAILFNSSSLKEISRFNTHANKGYTFDVVYKDQNLILVFGDGDRIYIKEYSSSSFEFIDSTAIDFNPRVLKLLENCTIVAGSEKGELLSHNICRDQLIFKQKICNSVISKIEIINNHTVLITSSLDGIFYFDLEKLKITYYLLEPGKYGSKTNQLLSHFKNENDILWLGQDGLGVQRKNLVGKRFHHSITELTQGKPIMGIQEISNGLTFATVLNGGYLILDENKSIIQYNQMLNEEDYNIRSFYYSNELGLVFFVGPKLFLLLDDLSYKSINFSAILSDETIVEMVDFGGDILCLESNGEFYFLKKSNSNFYLQIVSSNFQIQKKIATNIAVSTDELLFVSNNDEFVSVWDWKDCTSFELCRLPLDGEIKSALKLSKNLYYISTVKGLFKCNIVNNKCDTILDNNNLLAQTIYSVIPNKNKFWLSTNSGIIQYDSTTNESFQFTEKDGVARFRVQY